MAKKTTIANLAVLLTLDGSSFTKGVAAVQKRARTMGTAFTKTFAAIGAAATAGLGAVAVAGVRAVQENRKSIDALAKTSDRLGIPIEKLQVLHLAASRTGVGVRTLELGMQRMTRRVSEAAKGTGEAQAAIKELGIDARDLVQLSPDQQFLVLADAMEKVTNQADRVRLGFKLFDSEGVALINTMRGGSEAMDGVERDMHRLGGVVDRDGARQVEVMNDAFRDLGVALSAAGRDLTVALAPALTSAADGITDLITGIDRLAGGWKAAQMAIVGGIDALQSTVATTLESLSQLETKLAKIADKHSPRKMLDRTANILGFVGATAASFFMTNKSEQAAVRRWNERIFRARAARTNNSTTPGTSILPGVSDSATGTAGGELTAVFDWLLGGARQSILDNMMGRRPVSTGQAPDDEQLHTLKDIKAEVTELRRELFESLANLSGPLSGLAARSSLSASGARIRGAL